MQCPVCNDVRLEMTDRQGVEIDYCPKCRGVWLDRGELDKLIERSAGEVVPDSAAGGYAADAPGKSSRGKHKRKSLLGELFDF